MAETRGKPGVDRFVLLYALAWTGAAIGYTPLLTILLPVQVAQLAGTADGVEWLASIALAGAIAASLASISFGYLSDITRNRRGWLAGGLVLSCLLLGVIGQATSLPGLIVAIVCWQLALNMMLAPLAAWAGDVVPDRRKGLLGGLMAFAPGMGALSGAVVTYPGLADGGARLWLVAVLVVICVLPVLLLAPPAACDPPCPAGGSAAGQRSVLTGKPARVIRMWLARLLVQVAEATLFAYLYFWLLELDPSVSDNLAARLFSVILLLSAPLALIAGRWSDCKDRPMTPLIVCALLSALGLAGMAFAPGFASAIASYGLFGLASAVFLALHSAQTLQILPRPERRGRDLGLFNLANTLPSLAMPWLAVSVIPLFGFQGLFVLLAALAAVAGLLLVAVRRNR